MLIARFSSDYAREQSLRDHAGRVARIARMNLEPLGLGAVGEMVGWLHDVGKSLRGWQAAIFNAREQYLRRGHASRRPLDVPHAPPSAQIIYRLLSGLASNKAEQACLQIICMAVAAHHGYLMDALSLSGEEVFEHAIRAHYPENKNGLEAFYDEVLSVKDIESCFRRACQEIAIVFAKVPKAADLTDDLVSNRQARHFHIGMIARNVYAALIDADRLDAARFEDGTTEPYQTKAIPNWSCMLHTLEAYLNQFPQATPTDQMRKQISERCAFAGTWEDPLLALHAPTGSGKTLASLRMALQRANLKNSQRIYYVVSYTTILDQVYGDYQAALHNGHHQPDILLHHSNIIPEEVVPPSGTSRAYQQLLFAERWDADIILTTQVQFFNALFLGVGKAARRLRGLNQAVIIFDEVQTVPPRLTHLFNLAINYLTVVCGCHVILSSATQPAYMQMQFPMLPARNVFDQPDQLFQDMRRVRLIDRRSLGWMDAQTLADFAIDQQVNWHSVLVVLNTRAAARKVFDALIAQELPGIDIHLLSNDLCPAHRKRIIDKLKNSRSPCICVSTQLIECGVNLSFGCAIRSLAGADSIWQTAGRCNRHGDGGIHPVYIIRCIEEHLDKLQDIVIAQKASDAVLHNLADADLLQLPSEMKAYYLEYYRQQVPALSFPIKVGDRASSVVQLLSNNKAACEVFQENHPGGKLKQMLNQAFATAGHAFSVIDSPAIAIIAPYEKGEAVILDLNGNPDIDQTKRLLREAQMYSINIFQHQLRRLMADAAVFELPCGAIALRKEWYDENKRGLTEQPMFDSQASLV